MRIEPHIVGSIVHVIKRGARGMDIVRDDSDKSKFVKSIFLLNDVYSDENWSRVSNKTNLFERPPHWPEREPLVRILAWTLLPNHFHLLLQEIREGGIAKFMQRLCGSMSLSFNTKYGGQGSLFQGSYKGRLVEEDDYFRYLVFYISVKNVFEAYPGGLKGSLEDFDAAWEWAMRYPYSSLGYYLGDIHTPVTDDPQGFMNSVFKFEEGSSYKDEAKKALETYMQMRPEEFDKITLENW